MEKKTCSAGRSAQAQTSCRRRGKVGNPARRSETETPGPWGDLQPGEVRDTSCAAFRCRSPGSSGKPGDLPVGAVINRPPHRGPDGHRRADRGGSSVIKNNLPALGAAGGWDIRWRNERGILPAQMLCILRQVRWSGFPRLWQPIDSIVALQSAAPHFRAAKRTIQTNLLLFRYPQERDLGKPSVFPVLSPAAKEDLSIIFGRTCACRKYIDLAALGGVPSDRRHWGGGRSRGDAVPLRIRVPYAPGCTSVPSWHTPADWPWQDPVPPPPAASPGSRHPPAP